VATSAGGKAALERGKGGGDGSWADTNLTQQKMKKIHAVYSVDSNG
jgi:hypothetical protein